MRQMHGKRFVYLIKSIKDVRGEAFGSLTEAIGERNPHDGCNARGERIK